MNFVTNAVLQIVEIKRRACVYLVLQVSPKKEVARVRGSRWPFHAMVEGNDTVTKQFSQTITDCNYTMCRSTILNPPEISECSPLLHLKMLLKLWYHVVVQHLQIIQSIYISVKKEWPDYLVVATKSDPDCQFVLTTVDMEIKCGCFSCSSILPNVVGFNLAVHGKTSLISNND